MTEHERVAIFEGDFVRPAGFGALLEPVGRSRFFIVGNPLTDGLPRRFDGFDGLDIERWVGWWRDVDDTEPKSVDAEEEFDFAPAEEGVDDLRGGLTARALERQGLQRHAEGDFWIMAAKKEKQVLAVVDFKRPISGTATAANGTVFVATMSDLYALRQGASLPPAPPAK